MARVLKIDVVVDESGQARRSLAELESGVKKVETTGYGVAEAVARLNAKFAETEKFVDTAVESVDAIGAVSTSAAANFAVLTLGLGATMAVAGAAGAAIYELGNFVKGSTQHYIDQSGVLDINRGAVEHLSQTWDDLRFTIGELIVGGNGDYRSWIDVVDGGLQRIDKSARAAASAFSLLQRVSTMGAAGAALDSAGLFDFAGGGVTPPGIDTSERNRDGSLTPYGQLVANRKKLLDPTRGGNDPLGLMMPTMNPVIAEQEANRYLAEQKREQLELERQQKKEAQERLQYVNEHVKLENELTQAIQRSKEAFDNEIAAAERANAKMSAQLSASTKDGFLKASMSGGDFARYQVGAKADRDAANVDPRAANASELLRRIEAEKELSLIQLRQAAEGMTAAVSDDLNHFRAQFVDVIGQLPVDFAAVVPPIVTASGEMRDSLTGDLDAVRGRTDNVTQGFALLQGNLHATKQEIADGLMATDRAYRDAGFMVQMDPDVTRLRRQQTGGIIFSAAGGYVEPSYLARGGPAGTDTVPAFLTPGEGVLSRTGMGALDRLNAGGSIGRGGGSTIVIEKGAIDARGAQFSDEASLDRLADKLAQRVSAIGERTGSAG
jgi:hypothetical protein